MKIHKLIIIFLLTLNLSTAWSATVVFTDDLRQVNHYLDEQFGGGNFFDNTYQPTTDWSQFTHIQDGKLIHDSIIDTEALSFSGTGLSQNRDSDDGLVFGGLRSTFAIEFDIVGNGPNDNMNFHLSTLFTDGFRPHLRLRKESAGLITLIEFDVCDFMNVDCAAEPISLDYDLNLSPASYRLTVFNASRSGSPDLYGAYEVNGYFASPVPLPASAWLFCSGLLTLISFLRHK